MIRLGRSSRKGSRWAPGPPTLAVLVALAIVPQLAIGGRMELTLTFALAYATAAVGLGLFSGFSGQLAMGNFGFVAIGAYTSVIVVEHLGFPVLLGLPAAMLVSALVAGAVGLPMVRLPYLGGALLTFFFAAVVTVLLTGQTLQGLTQSTNGLAVPVLEIGGTSFAQGRPTYYFGLGVLVLAAAIAVRYATSRAGRALRLIKRSETVAAALGVNVTLARVDAFVFSGMVAGAAGFVYAQTLGYIAPESFSGLESIILLAMVVVGGIGTIAGPIIGAVFFNVLVEVSRAAEGSRELVFALALLLGLIVLPNGIFGAVEAGWRRLRGSGSEPSSSGLEPERAAAPATPAVLAASPDPPSEREGRAVLLSVRDVAVAFGGVRALDGVSLTVEQGSVHAIIGPNGAGKTTLLNAISGLQPHSGAILLDGEPLEAQRPRAIRERGIVRTFQNPSLVPDLTVRENVEFGAYGLEPSGVMRDLLPLPSTLRRDRQALALADRALDLVGMPAARRDLPASGLTLSEQKITDIARAICGRPRLLLLDEPSAGLGEQDIERMIGTLGAVAEHATIVVIAHHVGFLRAIADDATALNFGRVLATGHPDEVTRREDVAEVYLGTVDA